MSNKNENKGLFKEVFKGYSKEEVTAYIECITGRFNARESELTLQLERLHRQSLDDAKNLTQLRERITELENQAAAPAEVPAEPSVAPVTVPVQPDPRVAELEGELSSREIYIAEMNQKLRSLEEQIADLVRAETTEPQTVYDEVTKKLGRMIFSAEQTSKEIVESAKARAADIIEKAESESRRLHEQANAELEQKTAHNRSLLNQSREDLNKFLIQSADLNTQSEQHLRASTEAFGKYLQKMGELSRLQENAQ